LRHSFTTFRVSSHQRRARVKLLRRRNRLNHRFNLALQVVTLIDHVGDVRANAPFPFVHLNLVKNAKHLVGIDGAECQVVVRVAAVVEMKSPDHAFLEQPSDDLLDVLRLIVVSRIHQDRGLRPGFFGQQIRHSPVGDIGVIEGRFERFVFDQKTLPRLERAMNFPHALCKILDPLADILRTGVIRTVGEPRREIPRTQKVGDFDAIQNVIERFPPYGRIGVADRSVLIFLVLEDIRIDRAGPDAIFSAERIDVADVVGAIRQVPLHVQR